MSKQISPKTTALAFLVLVVLFLAAFYTFAWSEPAGTPPASNIAAPINVSTNAQTLLGSKRINRTGASDVLSLGTGLGVDGNLNVLSGITMNNSRITGLPIPNDNAEAATKGYVDAKLAGGGGAYGGLDFYQTSGTYSGAQAGTACASGYHMCLAGEMIGRPYNSSLGSSGNLTNYSWIFTNGRVSYEDCRNWSTSSASYSGIGAKVSPSVETEWYYYSQQCPTALPVLCCENMSPEIDSSDQAAVLLSVAATACRNRGGNWHLPSSEELLQYAGIIGSTANLLWTTSPASDARVFALTLNNGNVTLVNPTVTARNYRCVR